MSKVYKVFEDIGHGGSDSGAASGGLVEKTMNLVTGLECKAVLEQYGVEVMTSRDIDKTVSLSERVRMANEWGADYFISQHYNAGGGDRGEVIHSIYRGKGLELANSISSAMKSLGQETMKIYERRGEDNKDYYYVIKNTNMDAVIVEGGFIDNAVDRKLFDTVEEQKAMGRAIAYGILDYLGISHNTSSASNKTVEPKYYVETSYIKPEVYCNALTDFFNKDDVKFQIKSDSEGPFIQTMHMPLDRCNAMAYVFTGKFDIMAYVWREDKITDAYGNITYSDRILI